MIINVVKIIVPAMAAFGIGIGITPILTHYLYKYKAWKKSPGKTALDGTVAVEFNKLHKDTEAKTPRMGGIVIWGSVCITAFILWVLPHLFLNGLTIKLDFTSRNQTWIPLFTLLVGSLVGLLNDFFDVTRADDRGLHLRHRLIIVSAVALFVGWWFYEKLGITAINIPFNGMLILGWLIIPLFILISLALYASGIIDGIDGLSAGVFATIFAAYGSIAFVQHQYDLAAFCATVVGGTLAFLWFNIPPARFYMTETGTMGITITLAVIAFMTDSLGGGIGIAVLPIIAFPLVVTVLSAVIQIIAKRYFKRKVFRVAPLHHHFEAIGWPSYKVTMRFWVIGIMFALIGSLIAFIG